MKVIHRMDQEKAFQNEKGNQTINNTKLDPYTWFERAPTESADLPTQISKCSDWKGRRGNIYADWHHTHDGKLSKKLDRRIEIFQR